MTELVKHPVNAEDMTNLWDFYLKYWLPLGEMLTDMERVGMQMDLQHLDKILLQAEADKHRHLEEFMEWVWAFDPSLKLFNPNSTSQMQQLLFAPFFKEAAEGSSTEDDDAVKKTSNISAKGQTFFPEERTFIVENVDRQPGDKVTTYLTVKGLGIPVVGRTESGLPSVDSASLKVLAGEPDEGKYGTAYEFLAAKGLEEVGRGCSKALNSLLQFKSIETLVNSFITPLQSLADPDGRIHYSLNINTETGRLSARRPNTQNQPALDK